MNTENEKIYRKVYNGYIFAYPLVLSDLYRDIRVANAQGNLAAATHLTHMPIITLESKVQGGPNMDVHYSGFGWIWNILWDVGFLWNWG